MKVQCVLLLVILDLFECARILGVIPIPSYSHQVVFQPLWKELSLRGHQVTLLTTNPMKDPSLTNLTEIDLSFSYKFMEENLVEIIGSGQFKSWSLGVQAFNSVADAQLRHHEVQRLIQSTDNDYDLVIAEYALPAPLYFSKKFNCPYIGVISTDALNYMYQHIGNPAHPTIYPNPLLRVHDQNLIQRIFMVLMDIYVELATGFFQVQEKMGQKHFQDDTPVKNLLQSVSLLFVNRDPIFHKIRPLLPSVIPIGGSIVRIPVKPMEKSIKRYLDDSHQGFIYFSLGTNIKSKDIPSCALNTLLKTFRELPYRILWKYDLDDLPNKPENVMISKWVSQMDVLKHSNLKLFITHGGAQSMEETIQARVPVVGMPFFVDQPFNVQQMVSLGFALSVDYKTMSKESFKQAILEVIDNNKYRNRIRELADLAEDQPMTGLERAVWWTEYVIRHKGAAHLKSPALDMPWYQYYFLDVISVLLLTFIGSLFFIVKAMKATLRALSRNIARSKEKKN